MRGDVWIVPAEGGEAVALTEGPAYHSEPTFSPDGRNVALTLDLEGNLDLGLVDAGGCPVERLTSEPEVDFAPAWSPDGRSLYFVSRRRGNLDVFRLDLETKAVEAVVAGPRNDFQPAVSPDGRKLAFVSPVAGRGGSGGIWILSLGGGEPELVHYEETSYRAKPQWSPDGASLFYSSDAAGSNDVAVVPSTGGDRVRLTEDPPGEFDELDPAVSPDGSRIVFVSNHQGRTALYTLSSAGGARSDWREVRITSRRPRFPAGRVRGIVKGPEGSVVPARLMLLAGDGRAYSEDGGSTGWCPRPGPTSSTRAVRSTSRSRPGGRPSKRCAASSTFRRERASRCRREESPRWSCGSSACRTRGAPAGTPATCTCTTCTRAASG